MYISEVYIHIPSLSNDGANLKTTYKGRDYMGRPVHFKSATLCPA